MKSGNFCASLPPQHRFPGAFGWERARSHAPAVPKARKVPAAPLRPDPPGLHPKPRPPPFCPPAASLKIFFFSGRFTRPDGAPAAPAAPAAGTWLCHGDETRGRDFPGFPGTSIPAVNPPEGPGHRVALFHLLTAHPQPLSLSPASFTEKVPPVFPFRVFPARPRSPGRGELGGIYGPTCWNRSTGIYWKTSRPPFPEGTWGENV